MDINKYMAEYGQREENVDNVNDWYKAFYMCQLQRELPGVFKLDNFSKLDKERYKRLKEST